MDMEGEMEMQLEEEMEKQLEEVREPEVVLLYCYADCDLRFQPPLLSIAPPPASGFERLLTPALGSGRRLLRSIRPSLRPSRWRGRSRSAGPLLPRPAVTGRDGVGERVLRSVLPVNPSSQGIELASPCSSITL